MNLDKKNASKQVARRHFYYDLACPYEVGVAASSVFVTVPFIVR